MKKHWITATAAALLLSFGLNSCIGSFALTNKLLSWNRSIDNKIVNELVFFVFWIVPVYQVSSLADILVLNSIEFWSGESPVASHREIIDGNDSKYLVESDETGYTITRLADNTVTRLNFDAAEKSWSVVDEQGGEHVLFMYIDDSHVRVPGENGEWATVELSQQGVYDYKCQALYANL